MDPSFKLIYNPAAQGGKTEKTVKKIREYLDKQDVEYGFIETEEPLDGIVKAEEAAEEGYTSVCSIGGDGTANEVANGAINAGIAFGLIPAGSGNDFAMGIGLNGDWKEAIDVILKDNRQPISVVKINERYSINIVDAGLGGDVAKRSVDSLKWMSGSKKYTILMLRQLLSHKTYPCELIVDGEKYDFDVNLIAAGFGQTFGSGMRILPEARYNKDEMEIAVIHSASKFTIARIFPKVFSGTHVNQTKYVTMLTGKEVIINPKFENRTMLSEAEGELVGSAPMTLEAINNGLDVLVPENWSFSNTSLWVKDSSN